MTKGGLNISKGTFDKDGITTKNSLYTNGLQDPQIGRSILMLQPQFSLTNITAPFINTVEDSIGDWKYAYAVMGRSDKPLTCTGTAPTGTGVSDSIIYIETYENYAHPTWEYTLGEVLLRVDSTVPIKKTVKGYLNPFKIMGNEDTDTISSTEIYDGRKLGKRANSNVEYSERGYGAQMFPDWLANYMTTTRRAHTVTGDAAASIILLEKNNNVLWAIASSPEEFMNELGERGNGFLWELEQDAWFGRTTMRADGTCSKTDNGKPIIRGNGFLQQIKTSMTYGFNKRKMNRDRLLNFVRDFKQAAGITKGSIIGQTGAGGMADWYRFLSNDYLDNNRGIVYTMDSGRQVTVGEDIPKVHLLGVDIMMVENPILTDPLNNDTDDEGLSLLGQSYFFIDGNTYTDRSGKQVGVVQRKVAKANGVDRGMITRVVDGMVNPVEPDKLFAASARDGYSVEWLSQGMTILARPNAAAALMCNG